MRQTHNPVGKRPHEKSSRDVDGPPDTAPVPGSIP